MREHESTNQGNSVPHRARHGAPHGAHRATARREAEVPQAPAQAGGRRRIGLVGTLLVALLGGLLPLFGGITPAMAAGGSLSVSLTAVASTVPSGQGASFRVQWSCSGSGSCDNATIKIPVPTGQAVSAAFPDGVPLTVTSQSQVQIGGQSAGSAAVTGTAPNQMLVWTFPASVPTGTSDTVTFTVLAPNSVTPNGTTITPVATFAADGASSVTDSATTTVTSSISLKTAKVKMQPTSVPYVNQQVTYGVMVGYDSQFRSDGYAGYARDMGKVCEELGTQALQNLTVTDTLPAGAVFVAASDGGAYDASTGTIVWKLGSSIADSAPYACRGYGPSWAGAPMTVTVTYPSSSFSAASTVTNTVVATANAWGQPNEKLTSNAAASHGLRVGGNGASVQKQPGYDWAVGNPLYRTVNPYLSNRSYLYTLSANSLDSQDGRWKFTDMLPCSLTSPTSANATDCSTPAFTDLQFGADGYLPELQVHWTTNAGTTGICTIAAGTSTSDHAVRFCSGTDGATPVPVPSGEYITKFSVDTVLPSFGGGTFYIYGRPSEGIPDTNVNTVYNNKNLVVDRSDKHPWFVTVENCPVENVVEFGGGSANGGRSYYPYANQTAADSGGICGYRQVMSTPVPLAYVKAMYDPAIPVNARPAVPAVQTGDKLTVDLTLYRSTNSLSTEVVNSSTFTPTATEYLPAGLSLVDGSVSIAGDSSFAAALGTPKVVKENVTYKGEPRTKVTVTFPDAVITSAATMGKTAYVRFQVSVNQGTPAGTYENDYLETAAEAGPGVNGTYLVCGPGAMVDADLNVTTDHAVAVGCLGAARYTVLPTPGVSAEKTVQGASDGAPIAAPGVGTTSVGGAAKYTIKVTNSGSVDIRNVVAYDLLPYVGDTLIIPGAKARGSEFPVLLTGPVAAPSGATVQYSTAANPCRGDLAGTGGAAVASAPSGCTNDWSATPPADYTSVTGVRIDFGSRTFAAGDTANVVLSVKAGSAGANLDGVAWNSTAVRAIESSNSAAFLPTEASPVGLQVLPDLAWQKVDGLTAGLIAGSEWSLSPVLKDGESMPKGWPISVTDCTASPCTGPDIDPVAGQFRLAGIPWGIYQLIETVAPADHVLNSNPIKVTLDNTSVDRQTYVANLGRIANAPTSKPVPGFSVAKSSDPGSGTLVKAGDTITYTVTGSNTGNTALDPVTVTDKLADVLDDADLVSGSLTASTGAAPTVSGTTLTWTGTLAAGEQVTITYQVKVKDSVTAGEIVQNVASGSATPIIPDPKDPNGPGTPGTPITPPDAETEHPVAVPGFLVTKTSDPASGKTVKAGDTITYTVTGSNTGNTALDPVKVTDNLAGVLSDADLVSGSLKASTGAAPTVSGTTLTWTGTLAAGELVTITYQVKVKSSVAADAALKNVATGSATPPGGDPITPPGVDTEHPVGTPGFTLTKSADPASGTQVLAGDTITYTVTGTNTGNLVLNPVTIVDDLSGVLANADLVSGSLKASTGNAPTVSGTTLTWTGQLSKGAQVTLTYKVKVKESVKEATLIHNAVSGSATPITPDPDNPNGPGTPGDPITPPTQETQNPVGVPGFALAKSSTPGSGAHVKAGDVITYTVTGSNTGNTALDPVKIADNLSGVLDDAELVAGSLSASTGTATITGTTLEWTGALQVAEQVTITYQVKVKSGLSPDAVLVNVAHGEATPPGGTTPVIPSDPQTDHPVVVPGFALTKSSDPASGTTVKAGQVVTYTVTGTNTGDTVLKPVTITDNMADVLDDADLVAGSLTASSGTAPTLSGTTLSWTGTLEIGEHVVLSYKVKVKSTVGTHSLVHNTVQGTATPIVPDPTKPNDPWVPGEPLTPPTVDTESPVAVPGFTLVKSANPGTGSKVAAGQTITFTVTARTPATPCWTR